MTGFSTKPFRQAASAYLTALFCALALATGLSACSPGPSRPETIARNFVVAFYADGDADKVMSFYPKVDDPQRRELIKKFIQSMVGSEKKLAANHSGVKDVKVAGKSMDEAAGKATIRVDILYNDGAKSSVNVKMEKAQNGAWKISR